MLQRSIYNLKKSLLISVLLFAVPIFALAYVSPGRPSGIVNDFAGVLTAEQMSVLEQTLLQNQQSTGNEISIVTIKSLDGDTIENYAVKLFEEWGIGQKNKDNGVLLLVSVSDHKMRIEVGYGLEPVLTDAVSSQIIRNVIAPQFKQNNYYEGIVAGVSQIISATNSEVNIPAQNNKDPWWGNLKMDFFLFWLGSGLLQLVLSVMARSRSWWLGGIVGGAVGLLTMFFITLVHGLIVMAVLVPIGFLLDYFISREYARSSELGRKPRWWAGGPWIGGGFGGSGGFGGFGGGSSGGGGASGDW